MVPTEGLTPMTDEREKVTICVIDDNPQNLLTVEAILAPEGYNVVTLSSGKSALKYLLENEVAVILCDVVMPDIDGFETARIIRSREKTRGVPIIFTSAHYVEDADVSSGYGLGAIDYITLPLIPYILKAKVGALVTLFLKEKQVIKQAEKLRELERLRHVQELEALKAERKAERWKIEEAHLRREKEKEHETTLLLKEKTMELERSNAEFEHFSNVISHDLREPLRTVSLYLSLLKKEAEGRLPSAFEEYLDMVCDASNRMSNLIRDLFEYAKVGKEVQEVRQEVSSLDMIESVRKSLDASVRDTGAEIHCENLPSVWVNPTQFTQVFQNLIGNAIKFTQARPPKIRVWAEREQRAWRFSVQDNGIGISPKFFDKIFGMFQRLHARGQFPGTGMGLAICKKIIELHGGRIWVESKEGEGTVFHFTVPDGGPATTVEKEAPTEMNGKAMQVLLVDDDKAIHALVRKYFEGSGILIDSASSGDSALEMVRAKKYDTLVLDIQMPQKDGFETLALLRANGISTPALAFTGIDFSSRRVEFLNAGFLDVVSKDDGPRELSLSLKQYHANVTCQESNVVRAPAFSA